MFAETHVHKYVIDGEIIVDTWKKILTTLALFFLFWKIALHKWCFLENFINRYTLFPYGKDGVFILHYCIVIIILMYIFKISNKLVVGRKFLGHIKDVQKKWAYDQLKWMP